MTVVSLPGVWHLLVEFTRELFSLKMFSFNTADVSVLTVCSVSQGKLFCSSKFNFSTNELASQC